MAANPDTKITVKSEDKLDDLPDSDSSSSESESSSDEAPREDKKLAKLKKEIAERKAAAKKQKALALEKAKKKAEEDEKKKAEKDEKDKKKTELVDLKKKGKEERHALHKKKKDEKHAKKTLEAREELALDKIGSDRVKLDSLDKAKIEEQRALRRAEHEARKARKYFLQAEKTRKDAEDRKQAVLDEIKKAREKLDEQEKAIINVQVAPEMVLPAGLTKSYSFATLPELKKKVKEEITETIQVMGDELDALNKLIESATQMEVQTQSFASKQPVVLILHATKQKLFATVLPHVFRREEHFSEIQIWNQGETAEDKTFIAKMVEGLSGKKKYKIKDKITTDKDKLYIVLEDTVVYLIGNAFELLIQYAENHKDKFTLFVANIINSGIADYFQSVKGSIKLPFKVRSGDFMQLMKPGFAKATHESFIAGVKSNKSLDFQTDDFVYPVGESWFPGLFAFFGDKFGGKELGEFFALGEKNKVGAPAVIIGKCVGIHYAYPKQLAGGFDTDGEILTVYRSLFA